MNSLIMISGLINRRKVDYQETLSCSPDVVHVSSWQAFVAAQHGTRTWNRRVWAATGPTKSNMWLSSAGHAPAMTPWGRPAMPARCVQRSETSSRSLRYLLLVITCVQSKHCDSLLFFKTADNFRTRTGVSGLGWWPQIGRQSFPQGFPVGFRGQSTWCVSASSTQCGKRAISKATCSEPRFRINRERRRIFSIAVNRVLHWANRMQWLRWSVTKARLNLEDSTGSTNLDAGEQILNELQHLFSLDCLLSFSCCAW